MVLWVLFTTLQIQLLLVATSNFMSSKNTSDVLEHNCRASLKYTIIK